MNHFLKPTYAHWIHLSPKLFLSVESSSLRKARAERHTCRPFVNIKRVFVCAGSGGDGCIAFQRLFCNANAGPSGGDGGNGAHVIFRASKSATDLSHVPSIMRGTDGGRGHGSHCHGANAGHTYLQVPTGTQVFALSPEGLPSSEPVIVLQTEGDIYLAARGGAGGKGNAFLTNAAVINAGPTGATHPGFRGNNPLRVAERGARGEETRLLLRMANLAHLGLVGAPNAGKSTLLRRLTRARPKVAPYPFTTMSPHVGILSLPNAPEYTPNFEHKSLTVADLPGILPGAAEFNTGLGAEFLSLITDCQSLAYVVDMGDLWTQLNFTCRSNDDQTVSALLPLLTKQLVQLKHELVTFDSNLGDPHRCLVIGTKLDIIFPQQQLDVDHPDWASSPYYRQFSKLNDLLIKAATQADIFTSQSDSRSHGAVVLVSARRGDNMRKLIDILSKQSTYFSRHGQRDE